MNTKQTGLVISWVIMLCAMYIAFTVNITLAFLVIFAAYFFRDIKWEKEFTIRFLNENKKIVRNAKLYSLLFSIGLLVVVLYLLFKGEYELLSDYKLVGQLLFVVLWPFLAIGVLHEMKLYTEYKTY